MTSPDLLAAFCYARLDEDEAVAKGPHGWKLEHWSAVRYKTSDSGREWRVDAEPRCIVDAVAGMDAAHIARHDPARVLREVAAMRTLITFAFRNAWNIDGEWGDDHTADEIAAGQCSDYGAKAAREVLVPLAAIWSDHPDYDPEWKP